MEPELDLPNLLELEAELQTLGECYSQGVVKRACVSEQDVVKLTYLYNSSQPHGLEPSDANKIHLESLVASLQETLQDFNKAYNHRKMIEAAINSKNLKKLGVDTGSTSYDGLVSQIIENYANAIIGAYQRAGLLDKLSTVLTQIKDWQTEECREFFARRGMNEKNFFDTAIVPSDEIDFYQPLIRVGLFVRYRNMESRVQLAVPGTFGVWYGEDCEETNLIFRCLKESDTLAKAIVNRLYSKLKAKNTKQA